MNKNRNSLKLWIKTLAPALAVSLFVGYFFFEIVDYPSVPWWKLITSDADNVYSASILTLINGEKLFYADHPGATLYMIYGLIFRMAAVFSAEHAQLMQFYQATNAQEATAILALATSFCRDLIFPSLIILTFTQSAIFSRLKCNPWISFILLLYVMSSDALVWYQCAVRAEPMSLMLFLWAYLCVLKLHEEKNLTGKRVTIYSFSIGYFLGLSILAKIQTAPAILLGLPCLLIYLYRRFQGNSERAVVRRISLASGLFAISNCILCPWWGFNRPAAISKEFIENSDPASGFALVYENMQESYLIYTVGVLGLLLCLSLISYRKTRITEPESLQYNSILLVLNVIVSGIIVSVYSVFFPISRNITQYLINTQHLIYAVMSSLLNSGYLRNKTLNRSIFSLFGESLDYNNFYIIPFKFFLVGVIGVSIYRIFWGTQNHRKYYLHSSVWIVIALMMAFVSSMRSENIFYSYYAIYPVTFFTIGIAIWLREEIKVIKTRFGKSGRDVVYIVITVLFIFHMSLRYESIRIFKKWYDKSLPLDSPSSELKKIGAFIPVLKGFLYDEQKK